MTPGSRPRPADHGRGRRLLLIALAPVLTLVGFFPVFSLGVLTPFIARDEGLGAATAGLVATGLFGAAGLASGQTGRFVDRFGARAGLVTMCLCSATSWFLASWVDTVAATVVAVAVAGVALALAIPAVTHMFFELFEGRRLGMALGVAHSGTQLGAVIAGAALPTLAEGMGWRAAVRSASLLPVIVVVLILMIVQRPVTTAPAGFAHVRPSFLEALRTVPGLARLTAFAMLVNAVVNAGVMYLPSYATTAFDIDLVTAGLTTMTMGVASIAGKVLWGMSRLGRGRKGLDVFVSSSVAVLLLLLLAPILGQWALWTGAALFGFTATTWAVPTTQVAGLHSGAAHSGTASAAVMMAGFLGGSVGPPLFGSAIGTGGFRLAWFGGMAVLGCSAVFLRRLAEPPTLPAGDRE